MTSQPSPLVCSKGDQQLHHRLSEGGRASGEADPLAQALLIANAIRQAVYGGDGPLGKPVIHGREKE